MVSKIPEEQNFALRSVFNEDATGYDAIRPGYPAQLIEDVLAVSPLPTGGRILEVGCGTGQATLPFAQRGYAMLCIDIGEDMLKIARRKLQDFPRVAFWRGTFENWPLEAAGFDLFLSATAFHWVPREVGYPKAAAALKPGGTLAIFSNEHPRQGRFFAEVQAVYARHAPSGRDQNPQRASDLNERIRALAGYIDSTHRFTPVTVQTYPWQQTYSTEAYLALLNTYSDMRAMAAHQREALLAGIAELIDRRFGGQVVKEYLSVLYLAKKL